MEKEKTKWLKSIGAVDIKKYDYLIVSSGHLYSLEYLKNKTLEEIKREYELLYPKERMKVAYQTVVLDSHFTSTFLEREGFEKLIKLLKYGADQEIEDKEYLEESFGITEEKYDFDNIEIVFPKKLDEGRPCYIDWNEVNSIPEFLEVDNPRVNSYYFKVILRFYRK